VLVPETVIDGNEEQLVFVGWAGTSPGIIALSQDQDAQVRFYGNDGALLRSVGRRGSGPAEFQSIRYLGWLADTLWIWDQRLRRLSFVDPGTGRVLRTSVLHRFRRANPTSDAQAQPQSGSARPLAVYPDRTILVAGAGLDGERNQRSGIPLYRSTMDGTLTHHVGRFPKANSRVEYRSVQTAGSVLIPFSADPLHGVSPHGDRIGMITLNESGTVFDLTIISPASDTLLFRTYALSAERIPEERRDSAREVAISRAIERGASGGAIRALENMRIPEVYPGVREFVLGKDHTTWIRLRDDRRSRGRWLWLDQRGDIVDTIYLPRTARLMEGARKHILVRLSDEMNVHSLVLFNLNGQ
jgi:hypothetical protein